MTAPAGDLATLLRAVHEARGDEEVPLPSPEPHDGQSVAQWRAEVARARAMADAGALRHRALVDRASKELFGTTVAELLPPVGPLARYTIDVPVPADPQPGGNAPGGGIPAGPGARVPDPATTVRVSVTTPTDPQSVIIRLHGGAFWMAGGTAADSIDAHLIDQLAHVARAVVLNVDYRLAPEHPFPAAIVDTLTVLDAVRAGNLGLATEAAAPIALVGTSSGANITTVAAMADAARRPASPLRGLGLLVPSVLLTRVPDGEAALRVRRQQLRGYLGDLALDEPWASPGVLPRIAGLPPTFAAIASADEVAAGGESLCAAIEAGGGEATAHIYEMTHTTATPAVEAALIGELAAAMRDALHP